MLDTMHCAGAGLEQQLEAALSQGLTLVPCQRSTVARMLGGLPLLLPLPTKVLADELASSS
jgi:hypothetical protein